MPRLQLGVYLTSGRETDVAVKNALEVNLSDFCCCDITLTCENQAGYRGYATFLTIPMTIADLQQIR
jgi:hypothetical protein